jgi:hypothetical protein
MPYVDKKISMNSKVLLKNIVILSTVIVILRVLISDKSIAPIVTGLIIFLDYIFYWPLNYILKIKIYSLLFDSHNTALANIGIIFPMSLIFGVILFVMHVKTTASTLVMRLVYLIAYCCIAYIELYEFILPTIISTKWIG